MQPPLSRWVWAGGLAFCVALGIGLVRLHVRPAPPPVVETAPAPAPSPLPEATCRALQMRYATLADTLRACTQDDECVAEPRGPQFTRLDGCTRYRRRDSSTGELDQVEQRWLQGACVTSFVAQTCGPRAVQCLAGRCVERPPDPIPRDWKRIDASDVFTFFAPAELEDQHVQGTDSMVGAFEGPLGLLDYDYGLYSNTLEGEDLRGGYPDAPRKTRGESVLLAGQKARLVTYRGKKQVRTGVYFAHVPKTSSPWHTSSQGENHLELSLVCKTDCEPVFLMIAHSLEFY